MVANLFGLLIFGSLVLLGTVLIANPLQVNKRANIWFGIFLFFWASFWLEEVLTMISGDTLMIDNVFALSFTQFLTPIIFYISIRYFTNPEYKFGRNALLLTIMPSLYITALILDDILTMDLKIIPVTLILFNGLTYSFLSLFKIRKHKQSIQQFTSNTVEIDLGWLENIVLATLFLVVGVAVYNMIFFDALPNLFMNILVYLVILFMAYFALKQKEIFPADHNEREEVLSLVNEPGYAEMQNKLIPADKLVDLKAQLHNLVTKDELYLDSELSLGKLAKKLSISAHQLSYVLNTGFNQSFYGYINRLRVEKAKNLLADKELDKYSIIGIAFESGFNSKTSFNTTFKRLTGLTPSAYKKSCTHL